jgi:hypothetical protein
MLSGVCMSIHDLRVRQYRELILELEFAEKVMRNWGNDD